MKSALTIFILGFIVGILFGQPFTKWLYMKAIEIRSTAFGEPPVIIDEDYITIKKVGDDLYLYINMDQPLNTVLRIPLNQTLDYYYNISKEVEARVSGNPNYISIVIRHKTPILL